MRIYLKCLRSSQHNWFQKRATLLLGLGNLQNIKIKAEQFLIQTYVNDRIASHFKQQKNPPLKNMDF